MEKLNSNYAGEESIILWGNSPSKWAEDSLFCLNWAGHFSCGPDYTVEKSQSGSWLLICTVSGSGVIDSSQGKSICGKGDVALLEGTEKYHLCTEKEQWEFYWFFFGGKAVNTKQRATADVLT